MAGETVSKVLTTDPVYFPLGPVAAGKPIKFEALTTELQLADQYIVGYIPAGATFVGAILKTDDLDANAGEALVWTLLVGSTEFDTATNAVAAAGVIMTGDFITVTAETPIYLNASTAAATAAAGTINFMPLYVGA